MEYALILSMVGNLFLLFALYVQNRLMREAQTRAHFYHKEVRELAKSFMIAQRNSVQRDPKTGRYMKKGK